MKHCSCKRGIGAVQLVVILFMLASTFWAIYYQITTAQFARQRNRLLLEMRDRGVKALSMVATDLRNAIVYLGDCPIDRTIVQLPSKESTSGHIISIRSAEGLDVSPMQLLGQVGGNYIAVLSDNNFKSGSSIALCNSGTLLDVNVNGITSINGKPTLRALQVDQPITFVDWQRSATAAITKQASYWIENFNGIPSLVEQLAGGNKTYSIKGVQNLTLIYHFIDGTSNETYQATPDLAGIEVSLAVLPTFGISAEQLQTLSPEQRHGITMSYTVPFVKLTLLSPSYEANLKQAKSEEELDAIQVSIRRQ